MKERYSNFIWNFSYRNITSISNTLVGPKKYIQDFRMFLKLIKNGVQNTGKKLWYCYFKHTGSKIN